MFIEDLNVLSKKIAIIKEENVDFVEDISNDSYEYLKESIINSQNSIGSKIIGFVRNILEDKEFLAKFVSSSDIKETELFKDLTQFEQNFKRVYDYSHDKFWELSKKLLDNHFKREDPREGEEEGRLKNKKLQLLNILNKISNILFPTVVNSEEIIEICSSESAENPNILCEKCNFRLNGNFSIKIGLSGINFSEINIDDQGNLIDEDIIEKTIEKSIENYFNYIFFESLKQLQEGGKLANAIKNFVKSNYDNIANMMPDIANFTNNLKIITDENNSINMTTEFESSLELIINLFDNTEFSDLLKDIFSRDISEYDLFKETHDLYELNELLFINQNYDDDLTQGLSVELSIIKFKEKLTKNGKKLLYINENFHNNLDYEDIFNKLEEVGAKTNVSKFKPESEQENQDDYIIDMPNIFDPYKMIDINKGKYNKYNKKIWSFLRNFVNWCYFLGELKEGVKLLEDNEDIKYNFTEMGIIQDESGNGDYKLKFILTKWCGSIEINKIA